MDHCYICENSSEKIALVRLPLIVTYQDVTTDVASEEDESWICVECIPAECEDISNANR